MKSDIMLRQQDHKVRGYDYIPRSPGIILKSSTVRFGCRAVCLFKLYVFRNALPIEPPQGRDRYGAPSVQLTRKPSPWARKYQAMPPCFSYETKVKLSTFLKTSPYLFSGLQFSITWRYSLLFTSCSGRSCHEHHTLSLRLENDRGRFTRKQSKASRCVKNLSL